MGFWNGVRKEIKWQNTTQEWVAQRAGLDHGTFRSAISKGQDLRLSRALRIASALETTVDALEREELTKNASHRVDLSWAAEVAPPYTGASAKVGIADLGLLEKAREYKSLLEDLSVLSIEVRTQFIAMVHGAAEASREAAEKARESREAR